MKRLAIKRLPVSSIRLEFQPPENLDVSKVDDIASTMVARKSVPPVTVYYDGVNYWLYDGFHRVAAATKCGRKTIVAEVRQGTYEDMEAEWRRGLEKIKKKNRAFVKATT